MITLFSHERGFRSRLDQALRTAGVAVRVASRPAELAKALAGNEVRLLIVGPLVEDRTATAAVCANPNFAATAPALLTYETAPDESIEEIVRRALALIGNPRAL